MKIDPIKWHKKYRGKIETGLKMPINNKADLSLAYTPGVGQVSLAVAKNPKESFNLTSRGNTIAVVSDGSAVLGLGNLGAVGAYPVMEGKAALFKKFGGVDAVPICLDTQDTEEIIKTVKAISPSFAGINLEDISAPRCFEIEKRLRDELDIPVLHDDQHGTAVVVLAALINALKLAKEKSKQIKIVVLGAGAAGTAVSEMLVKYGFKNVIVCDRQGAIYQGRPDLNDAKKSLAKKTNPKKQKGDLVEVIKGAKVFIGVSGPGLFAPDLISDMADKPIVFALSNPVPEIMPDVAKKAGAFVVATGRSDFPNQINNVLAFPGIFRGALDNRIKTFTDKMLIQAAENLAKATGKIRLDRILPDPFDKKVPKAVARAMHK